MRSVIQFTTSRPMIAFSFAVLMMATLQHRLARSPSRLPAIVIPGSLV